MNDHEHKWVCYEAGEDWNEEGTYFDRTEECDVSGCNTVRDVRYNLQVLKVYEGSMYE